MKKLFLFFCINASLLLSGQDAKSDFKKINEVYNKTMALGMDITYELFLDNSSEPYETETGKYIRQNRKYYTLQAGSEVIMTDDLMVMIDKDSKILAVDHKVAEENIPDPLSQSLDSLFALYTKIEYMPAGPSGIKGYRFYISEGPYSICEVWFDPKTNFVTQIKNVFREKITDGNDKLRSAVLKTTFRNTTTSVGAYSALFDEKKYIKKSLGKYVPAEAYKSYKFINHLN